ncbi:hypothetical protein KR054_010330 [Drosophila jambulina]|nr:hypothetical protein KR054_010330 [Drosophila jambulina]
MENCKLLDYISKGNGQKMITPQECLQMKRDIEGENHTDFEASPLALCMMITLLLFGICLWIWLISWSCFFGQDLDKGVKNEEEKGETKPRLSGGRSSKSQNKKVHLTNRSNKDSSVVSFQSRLLRNCNPITDYNHISHLGSSRKGGQTSPTTGRKESQMAESAITYGTTASSLGKESSKPSKRYKIQWTKFLKLGRRGDSKTESWNDA